MPKNQLKLICTMVGCLFSLLSSSQSVNPIKAKGQLKISNNVISSLSPELKSGLDKIRDIALLDSQLHYPTGFGVVVDIFADAPLHEIPWQKQKSGSLVFELHDQYHDQASNSMKMSEEYEASISIRVNSFGELYPDTYRNDVSQVNYTVPIFFFKYSIKQTDSTKDFLAFETMNGHPIRAITNSKQLFSPLTKEQWLTYKIAVDKKAWKSADDAYKKDQASVNDAQQHLQNAQKQPVKDDLTKMQMSNDSAMLENYKQLNVLGTDKKSVDECTQKLNAHARQLSSLSANEKNEPAYVLWNVNSRSPQADNIEELAKSDDAGAQALWTINPKYFNGAQSMAAIQLVTVSADYHPTMTSAYLKEKVMEIFERVDYEKLKAMIQH